MNLTFFLKLFTCIIIGVSAFANSASAATKMTKSEAIEHAMSLITPILSITYKDNIDAEGNKIGCFVNINTNNYSLFSMGVVAVRWNPKYSVGSDGDVVHPYKVAYMLESFEALGCN